MGGVGHDISNLRPENTNVSNSAGTSTGAVSFMERFSNSTRETAQNGRRGALMLSIDINHPDVEKFATIKSDRTKVTGANISIKLNREFMKAVKNDEDYILRWPCDSPIMDYNWDFQKELTYNKLEKIKLATSECYIKKIKAKELWDTIVNQAKDNAEPGLMFWDNVLDNSPDSVYEDFKPISSNPCGEQFLQAYDSCRLMCMNLFSIIKNPFTDKARVDWELLYKVAYEQQRLMDDLIDLEIECVNKIINKIENDPEPMNSKGTELSLWKNIRKTAIAGRRTGSGITALGDMLAALGIKYDSEEALKITDEVMRTKMEAELDCTIDLAQLRKPFESWDVDKNFEWNIEKINDNRGIRIVKGNNSFYQMLVENFPHQVLKMSKYGSRNISWSTINGGLV